MDTSHSLYIEQNNCQNCCSCIRNCSVKAIRFDGYAASIVPDLCIQCGQCYVSCPSEVVQIENHVDQVRRMIKEHPVVVASLSPAWVTDFPDIASHRMIEALKLLGFTHVSESSLGANKVVDETAKIIKDRPSIHISSVCPVITSLITKYHPDLVEYLIPLDTPEIAHAKMIHSWYGAGTKVVHITPCVAAKEESRQEPDLLAAALTFKELKEWMKADGVDFQYIPGNGTYHFEPVAANRNTTYVLEKGAFNKDFMIRNDILGVKIFNFSGLVSIPKILNNTENFRVSEPVFMEMLACDGGCVQGIGSTQRNNYINNELALKNYSRSNKMNPPYVLPPVLVRRKHSKQEVVGKVPEEIIDDTLASVDIHTPEQQLDCGGCGYPDCRSFARALALGHASRSMCSWLMKRTAQDQFTSLLRKIPSGLVIVDPQMRVVEMNANFARMLGPEAELLFDTHAGMKGYAIEKFIPFHALFQQFLQEDEREEMEKDVQVKDRLLKINLFRIPSNQTIGCIVRNLFEADVRNEEIVSRSQRVIRENLETVQRISYLLGENASRTEAILNSIIESQSPQQDEPQ